jgi:hypothetical protein
MLLITKSGWKGFRSLEVVLLLLLIVILLPTTVLILSFLQIASTRRTYSASSLIAIVIDKHRSKSAFESNRE